MGLAKQADGGTLVLDELLNLPHHAQRLLLDFVQFGTFRPLGYDRHELKRADVRIIAATNGNVRRAIREGRLREDLYHRLAHLEIEMPALRGRRADIPLLAERLLRRSDRRRVWTLSLDVQRLLVSAELAWPGNIRQLERVVLRARDRAVARDAAASTLLPDHVDPRDLGERTIGSDPDDDTALTIAEKWQRLQSTRSRLDEDEKDMIREAIDRANGVVARAARELGVARTTIASRVEVLGLRTPKGAAG